MSLFVFEGGDGCGKDSVANAVAEKIGARRLNFPNDNGYTGPAIRSYLRREWAVCKPYNEGAGVVDSHLSALAFQALQLSNRMEVMDILAQSEGSATRHHVLVRYLASGLVYGQLDGLPLEWLISIHRTVVRPQIHFLLDVSPEEVMRRRAARDGVLTPERYEGKLDLTKKVVELYRELWANPPKMHFEGAEYKDYSQWIVLDAMRPLNEVIQEALYRCAGVIA